MTAVKLAVAGANGRMGRILIESILQEKNATTQLVAALCRENYPQKTQPLMIAGQAVSLTTDLAESIAQADCLIDFTRPAATLHHLEYCQQYGTAMVIGTTGCTKEEKARIADAAKNIPIVFSANMSVGVNIVFALLELASQHLATHADIEIIEAHHAQKIDAPSGTALAMGEVIANVLQKNLAELAVYARDGKQRAQNSIGFSAIRAGDIIGEHTVLFASASERVEIAHKATNRAPYALGSLAAARFLQTAPPGLYDMRDVLQLPRHEKTLSAKNCSV